MEGGMTVPFPRPSERRLAELGERLGLAVPEAEQAAYADAVHEELSGYDVLDHVSTIRTATAFELSDVVRDPGPDRDPHNAYVTAFEAVSPDAGDDLADLRVAVKDNLAVAGVPMTCGSQALAAAVPAENAAVVDRLLDAGATLTGKTNMDEMAYGPTSETSGFGPVTNPNDVDRVAGGSSSGSAAIVAAGEVDAALGSDTGGSVRIPASFCGVVGFKPTWGVVPRTGFVDLAYTLDHVGPLARDVETAARIFDVIAGSDPRDPSSAVAESIDIGRTAAALSDVPAVGNLSLGVPEELVADHVSDGVRDVFEARLDALTSAGADVTTVSIPTLTDAVPVWNAITNAELAAAFDRALAPIERRGPFDLQWYDAAAAAVRGNGHLFGDVVKTKVILGVHLLDRYGGRQYVRARTACDRIRTEFDRALDGVDALVSPTMPVIAPEVGAWKPHSYDDENALSVPLAVNTRPADLAGVPAISVPAGTADGLPVGIQFITGRGEDRRALQVGHTFERFVDG